MTDYHLILGVLAVIIGAIAYMPYLRDVFRGTTKPHPFTFLVVAIVNAIAFFGQVAAGGGPGAWATGVTVIGTAILSLAGFITSRHHIAWIDYVCLFGAAVGVLLWMVTSEPLTAVVVATTVNELAFIPTIRKTYFAPFTETPALYLLGTVKLILGIFALDVVNATTVLFPLAAVVVNIPFLWMLYARRAEAKR